MSAWTYSRVPWHPSRRPRKLTLDPALRWTRLAVLETQGGGMFDTTGTVRFRAVYNVDWV